MSEFETQAPQPVGAATREEPPRDVVDEMEREHRELVLALQRELGLIV